MSNEIQTFVFFDIETTGLPWQEKNRTKITELCFVAVNRQDILKNAPTSIPNVCKLNFVLNPNRKVHPEVIALTGLSQDNLQNAPLFKEKSKTILSFLEELKQPVCLVAHNGNKFDFKIILTECIEANLELPNDLLCMDSLNAFRNILKGSTISYRDLLNEHTEFESFDWPDLDVSTEEWEGIDELCKSDLSHNIYEPNYSKYCDDQLQKRDSIIMNIFKTNLNQDQNKKGTLSLSGLYKRLLNKEDTNAHRAEADCMVLLECFMILKDEMLLWADENSKYLRSVKPLLRK